MSFRTPALMDNLETSATAIRLAFSSLIGSAGGLQAAGGLELTQKGTPNMSVIANGGTPAEGGLWVPGSVSTSQGTYFCWLDANYEQTIETAGASNPRIDTIIARVYDADYTGTEKKWTIEALKGKEESGVTLPAKKSSPAAVPASSYVLGYVLVPAKAASIVTADIENVASVVALPAFTASITLMAAPSGVYTAETSRTLGTEYEPSATRPTFVTVTATSVEGDAALLESYVGGVKIGSIVTPKGGEAVPQLSMAFIVPAKAKWKCQGTSLVSLLSSYLTL